MHFEIRHIFCSFIKCKFQQRYRYKPFIKIYKYQTMLKKLPLIFFILLFAMCKSKKNVTDATKIEEKEKTEKIYYTEQTRNDFRSVSEKVQKKFLKDYKADTPEYAILFFTQGFNGEKLEVKNEEEVIFTDHVTTDKTTGLAKNMRINRNLDTEIYDRETKKKIYVKAEKASKHKFVYIMKDTNGEQPYKITYSDKLRPAK